MAKRLENAAASRLSRQGGPLAEAPRLNAPVRQTKRTKSFRLGLHDIARLEALIDRVGEATGRRVTEAAVIGGVLLLGKKTATAKLITAVKDAAWE